MINIIQKGNLILRKKAVIIPQKEITKKAIRNLIKKMSAVLRSETVGIGLAAVQIGIPKAVFIISEYVLKPETLPENESEEEIKRKKEKEKYIVFINPRLIKRSKKKTLKHEGCLSIKNTYGRIKRSTHVTIEAHNENGQKFRRGAGGLFAQVIQHEMDHLKGMLFIDKAESVDKIS
ncbi:peptide deformylase [Patescibacteria group bacterium]|nr:peptide deformylase [Patescibacteria group bacterium]